MTSARFGRRATALAITGALTAGAVTASQPRTERVAIPFLGEAGLYPDPGREGRVAGYTLRETSGAVRFVACTTHPALANPANPPSLSLLGNDDSGGLYELAFQHVGDGVYCVDTVLPGPRPGVGALGIVNMQEIPGGLPYADLMVPGERYDHARVPLGQACRTVAESVAQRAPHARVTIPGCPPGTGNVPPRR